MDDKEHSAIPVPDPTTLTTDALRREIAATKDLLRAEFKGATDAIDVQLNHIDIQFKNLDDLRIEQKADSQAALTAALAAAKELGAAYQVASKEAIDKSEKAMTAQMEGLATMVRALEKSLDDRINTIISNIADMRGTLQ